MVWSVLCGCVIRFEINDDRIFHLLIRFEINDDR
jgi:hypothetical protein